MLILLSFTLGCFVYHRYHQNEQFWDQSVVKAKQIAKEIFQSLTSE